MGLDREAIAGERWFGAKGRTIGSIELEDSFVLDADASHVLAVARPDHPLHAGRRTGLMC